MARLSARRALGAVVLAATSVTLASCSHGAAVSEARQACAQVAVALATYRSSQAPGLSPTEVAALEARAQDQLVRALGSGGRANSADGSYGALMTNIQEASRVPIRLLVPALTRQCAQIRSAAPYLGS
jgi:hypothetical protein